MKNTILKYGLVTGVLLCINMIIMINIMYNDPNYKGNDILGYTVLIVIFSLIFFGIRNYRNNQLNGYISFGKAFKIGALIALVAATLYVIVGLLYYYVFVPDFLDVYIDRVLNNTPEAELEAKAAQMENFKELYKNPLFAVFVTYMEVLPLGLIIALISSLILKRKEKSNN